VIVASFVLLNQKLPAGTEDRESLCPKLEINDIVVLVFLGEMK
jgi:hypothetical protein